ncbi:sensor histidine kinase [Pseudoalteromonas luteoviolacea]|uniref:sensor histidine kinase n=1 Tax=Pseudoalteromonas luteoviolacea TaxID=43657 RepID=UPI00114E4FD7|nr:sensor histidine kinase [Pseudoalteromonas luteoviolacea]TQF67310.1 histidine kinase [Pseudoalteromonas luteoviolacea]
MRCLLLILIGFFLIPAYADISPNIEPTSVNKDTQFVTINKSALFYFDYNNEFRSAFDFDNFSQQFRPLNDLHKKPKKEIYSKWVYFKVTREVEESNWILSFGFPRLAKLSVYQKTPYGWLDVINLTEADPFSKRPIQDPQFYIPLKLNSGENTFLIEYQTFANAPANIRLHSQDNFLAESHKSLITNASLAGVIAAILLIVLVNLFFNRNSTNVYYATWTFLFFLIVIDTAGFTFQYFWPDYNRFSGQFSIFLMATVPLFHLLFVRGFLQLKHYHPLLNKVYCTFICVYGALVPIALLIDSVYFNLLLSTLVIPVFIYTCTWSIKQKGPGMRTFTFSLINHLVFLNIFTILGASYGNLIDVFDITSFIKIGYLIEVLLFTIALALQHKSLQSRLLHQLQHQVHALNQTVNTKHKEVNDKEVQLKAKEEKLFTDLSHELRTPLTVMKIQVESLQYNIVDNVQDSYNKLMTKIDELHSFIDQLMLVTDDKDIAALLNKETLNAKVYLNEVFQTCIQEGDPKKSKFSISNFVDDQLRISVDKQTMENAILEVVKNALRFGGDNVEISLTTIQDEQNLVIKIEDSGMPLSYEAHQQLFQPLFREDVSRSAMLGGKGMGLAVCKKIIESHEGKIDSHNSLLGGLCIEISLPIEVTEQHSHYAVN